MSKLLKINKDILVISLLIVFSLIIHHSWISFNSFIYSDYGYMSAQPLKEYINFSSWIEAVNLGSPDVLLWKIPILSLHGILGNFGLDTNITDKFLVMLVWIVASVSGSYLVSKSATKSRVGGIIGSFVFCYNTYFLAINSQGHFNISIAASLGLFSIYFLQRLVESKLNYKNIFFCSITLFLTGIYDLRVLYIFAFLYLLFVAYYSFSKTNRNSNYFKNTSIKLFSVFTLLLIYNLFWILPIIGGISINSSVYLSRDLFGDQFWKLSSAITLYHPFWNGLEPVWFKSVSTPWFSFAITFFAFSGFFAGKKDKIIVFFAFVAFIGIFLAKQTNPPFGYFYNFLFDKLPGFQAFRESTKFYILIAIGYSVLIPRFWVSLDKYLLKKFSKKIIYRAMLISIFLAPFALNTKIIFNSEIGSTYKSRQIPDEFLSFERYLLKEPQYFRILALPTFTRVWVYSSNHPWISTVSMLNDGWGGLVEKYDGQVPKTTPRLTKELLNSKYFNRIIDQSSIKYIFIPPTESETNDIYSTFYGENRNFFDDLASRSSFLAKTKLKFKSVYLYENKNFKPHIYRTEKPESIKQDVNFEKISFAKIRKAEYEIDLKNITKKTYVNFTESFDTNWKMGVSEISFIDKLIGRKVVPDKFHHVAESGINYFIVDPSYIKNSLQKSEYSINPDKSMNVKLRIFYQPDSNLFIGLLISFTAIIVSLIFLIKPFVMKN